MAYANQKHPLQVMFEKATKGSDSISVRSYSGRNMFGEECLAIGADSLGGFMQTLVEYSFGLPPEEVISVANAVRRCRQDSMGMGIVVYFPGVLYSDVE